MFRILLADDEPIVLDSLQHIISQQYGDDCSVFTARSGREAITQAEAVHPDLAVMDINMPGINGIEAIRTIKEFSPGTQFLLLTAFDKFDYAKQAINLGVLDYLSKPFNRQRIAEAIDAAMARITFVRQRRDHELELREKLENARLVLETGLFYTFLYADDQQDETARYLDLLDLPSARGQMMVLDFGEPGGGLADSHAAHDYALLRESVRRAMPCLVGPMVMNQMAVFIPAGAEPDPGDEGRLREMARLLHSRIRETAGAVLRSGASRPVGAPGQFHNAYREALLAMQLAPPGEICLYQDLAPGQASSEEMRQLAFEQVREQSGQMAQVPGRPVTELIQQARNYIDANYMRDISLELVAENVALSPPYFSRLFRTQIGKTFIDYLTDLRIARASQLLREGRLSVKEITAAVGYSDPNYFSRIFKKITGRTPSEFRS